MRRLLMWLTRRMWFMHYDRVMFRAYEQRLIDSELMHELDHRFKYAPTTGTEE